MGPQQQNYGYYGEQKRGINKKLILMIAAALVIIIGLIVTINVLAKQNSIGTQSQHLAARLTNLSTLTTNSAKQLKNDDLQKINAEAALITAGTQTDLVSVLPTKPDKSIVASESDTTDTTALSAAALAGTYDSEYKTVLTQKLESITAVLTEMYNKTSSKTTKATIDTDYKNFSALLKSLSTVTP